MQSQSLSEVNETKQKAYIVTGIFVILDSLCSTAKLSGVVSSLVHEVVLPVFGAIITGNHWRINQLVVFRMHPKNSTTSHCKRPFVQVTWE